MITAPLFARRPIIGGSAFVALAVMTAQIWAGPCQETVTIDSVTYPVTAHWCGRAVSNADLAHRKDLVLLPQALTHDDFEIAVLADTQAAFIRMAQAAGKDSVLLIADSGYRSLTYQRKIIRDRLAAGETFAKVLLSVAPPGYSEHHTGRALDLVPSEIEFASTKTYRWLKQHASEFGFYETMPRRDDTCCWEPWHWSWLGDIDSVTVK